MKIDVHKQMVSCLAADIKFIWTGKPKEMMEHSLICQFEKIRPIIQDLSFELLVLNKTGNKDNEIILLPLLSITDRH